MPSSPDLIVVGDLLVDVVVEAGALARGGDVHGTVRVRPAGSGANAAVWAASAGASVRLHGRVGDDIGGRLLTDALRERGVDAALTVDPDAQTGAMLVVREAGDRSMVADRGANARLSASDLPDTLEAGAVLVSGYLFFDPGSEEAALAALDQAKAPVVAVDACSWPLIEEYGPERFLSGTKKATLMLANEREAETLTGRTGDEAARELGLRYQKSCVKLGVGGAVACSGGELIRAASPAVDEADPTGAGDAFDGVLLAELAWGSVLGLPAMTYACEAGARAAASFEIWPEP
jgi:ribokinase